MARTIPADPKFDNNAEREVWGRLARQFGDDVILLPNLRLTDEDQDHEADILALVPGAGIITIEIKGGSVTTDSERRWIQSGGGERHEINPVEQVLRTKYALQKYVHADPRWRDSSRTRLRWPHAVVVPYSHVPADFSLTDCPRDMVMGADDQPRLKDLLLQCAANHEQNFRVPTDDDVELIAEILTGRNPMSGSVIEESDEREAIATRLTQEQNLILRATRLINRIEVRGGAGSGKTLLALTQAKQLTKGFGDQRPQRVALLCYSIGLGQWFKRQLDGEGRKYRPAFYGRFEELGRSWGAEITGDRHNSDFWEHELPAQMAELAAALPDGKKFDAIIVDEAQDFAEAWWVALLNGLRDPETGGVYVYSDENQALFPRFGRPPIALTPLVLDHNLRNTKQIADGFQSLAPMRMKLAGGDGPEITFTQASHEDVIDVAESEVLRLLDEGWESQHIALITTGRRHPTQRRLQEELGEDGYWRTFWESDDVFYGHVLGCKGLERRVVVLALNEEQGRDRAKERLYVGMSRPTDQLVVVGDRAWIKSVGGRDLAKKLGIA